MWSEQATWAELGYALLRLPVSAVAAMASILAWAVGLGSAALPVYGRAMPSGGPTLGGAVLHTRAELTGSAVLGLLVVLAAPQLTRGLAHADGALARLLLGPRRDLAARVAELEISRERVVDAAEAERRRIERDLHDGAQQRLVALAMELGRAKDRFADDLDAARELVGPGARRGQGGAHRAARPGPRRAPAGADRPWPRRGPVRPGRAVPGAGRRARRRAGAAPGPVEAVAYFMVAEA